ncbi:MAG: hypothetical protein EOO73_29210 [Myxococcales bacterium]|nr:MAG: hypothetical protein EOO73_29210 [Myxococcales bacterium]
MTHSPVSPRLLLPFVLTALLGACEEEAAEKKPAAPQASVPTAVVAPTPPPSAEPPPKLRDDCPKGSSGVGTSDKPCLASGDARMMEVKYTGKTTDEGPKFSIVNKSDSQILFGSLVAYFYDKAGKQLEVTSGDKKRPNQPCSGNIFAGAVKPGEKIFMFFSCVKKSHVPEGTATIEAEVKTVGFADEAGKKNEFYWSNPDLVPDQRPKGGGAAKTKK